VIGYELDYQGPIPDKGKGFFSSPQHSNWLWNPTSLLSSSYQEDLSPEVKQLGWEADFTAPSSAEVTNRGTITSVFHTSS
jgi:hypothetical protein